MPVGLSTHLRFRLSFLLTEQVGVCARTSEKERQFCIVLLPYHQPVGLQVALPAAGIVTRQLMGQIFCGEFPIGFEQPNGCFEQFHVKSTLATPFRILAEGAGHPYFVLHPSDA